MGTRASGLIGNNKTIQETRGNKKKTYKSSTYQTGTG